MQLTDQLNPGAPVGAVVYFVGDSIGLFTAPEHDSMRDKWLPLDGRSLSKARYPMLHRILVRAGIVSVGATTPTFPLPTVDGAFILGLASAGTGSTLGGTGGTPSHQHNTHATHTANTTHTHDSHTLSGRTIGGTTAMVNPATHAANTTHTHDAHSAHTAVEPPFLSLAVLIKALP